MRKETVQEYLLRGGKISYIPTGLGVTGEGKKLTREEVRERLKRADEARSIDRGRLRG